MYIKTGEFQQTVDPWYLRALILLLIIAPFGPYLISGVRVEQAVVYSIGLVALVFGYSRIPAILRKPLRVWILLAVVYLIATFVSGRDRSLERILASLDNHFIPLFCIVSTAALCNIMPTRRIQTTDKLLIGLCALIASNGLLAIGQSFGYLDLLIEPFLPSNSPRGSVSARAELGGRYGGIFNQPTEAGFAYSLGIITISYLFVNRKIRLIPAVSLSIAVIFGGILSGSKGFFPLGAMVLVGYVGFDLVKRSGVLLGLIIAVLTLSVPLILATDLYKPGSRLYQYINPDSTNRSLFDLYSAGRFGEGEIKVELLDGIQETLAESPIIGLGLGGRLTAIDIGLLEPLYQGGILGTILMFQFIMIMLLQGFRIKRDSLRYLYLAITLLAVLLFFGVPAFTLNRASSIYWIMIASIVSADEHDLRDQSSVYWPQPRNT